MAIFTRTLSTLGLVIAALSSSSVLADTFHHIDQLALTIQQQSQQLVLESRHYRHTPEYGHLVSDARQMAQLAEHLHEVAHHHGSVAHLQADLEQLDHSFHHLDSVFARVEHGARYGNGHVHGNTCHIRELLNAIEDNIHHLQDDLRSLCAGNPVTQSNAYRPLGTSITTFRPNIVQRPSIHSVPYPTAQGFGGHSGHARGFGYGYQPQNTFRPSSSGLGITFGRGNARFSIRF